MTSYYQGETASLVAQFFQYDGGPAVDVVSLTVSITHVPTSTVVVSGSTGYTHPATGVYIYQWAIPEAQTVGDYIVVWAHASGNTSEIINVQAQTTAGGTSETPDGAFYASREEFKKALDVDSTARSDEQIDRALAAGTAAVDGLLRRRFFPWTGTRYFDWPSDLPGYRPGRLWLDQDQLVSLTELSSGGVTIPSSDYVLYPNDGPPYDRIETNRSTSSVFQSGDTRQNSIGVTGVFGYNLVEKLVSTLSASVTDSATTITVTDGGKIGVGNVIRIDGERMIVTDRGWVDTGQNLEQAATAFKSSNLIYVTDGTDFNVGEAILLASEQMMITGIAGDVLTVERAWNGSLMADHSEDVDIYASRQLTVTRATLGTGASSHSQSASVYLHKIPGLVKELALAEAINYFQSESSGWARTSGSGSNEREISGRNISQIRASARSTYGRQGRMRAV